MRETMTRRHFLTRTGTVILVGHAASTIGPRPVWGAPAAKVGEAAPAFTATSAAGSPVSLGSYKGKIVVLEWTNHEWQHAGDPARHDGAGRGVAHDHLLRQG